MRDLYQLSGKEFQALLQMTGGDVELHMPRKRELVMRLHEAELNTDTGRWHVHLSDRELESAVYHMRVYVLNRPEFKAWLFTRLAGVYPKFLEVYERQEAGG
jgi:hypothetical protein